MIDKQFDDILKRKLENMTDASNSDWSDFEQKLVNEVSSDSLNEGGFDDVIKQKLAGMKAADVSSDWNTFEHMLDQDQITDQMLDEKVSLEMNSMRAPYRQDHWEMLHDNLEYRKDRNRNVIGYKIIELSLLFLILLSANNYFKYLPSTFEVEKPKIYVSLDEQINDAIAINDVQEKAEFLTDIQTTDRSTGVQNSTTKEQIEIVDELMSVESSDLSSNLVVQNTSSPIVASLDNSTSSNTITLEKVNNVASNIDEDLILGIPQTSSNIAPMNLELRDMQENVSSIAILNSTLNTIRDIGTPIGSQVLYQSDQKTTQSVSIYAGIDNNLVNSPFDDIYDTERFRTYGFGYSAGVNYGLKNGNKEWIIGLGYSSRSYDPRIIDELTGDAIVNLFQERVELDIFSIAAGLRYTIKENDNWSFDFGIGVSTNIVVHSNYGVEKVSILRNGDFVKGRGNNPPVKPLHDGVNEGGSLKENIYFTSDISFGLQRKLNENTFFTLRPEYSVHSFSDGIGPNNDLINNLSLNLGIKFNL